MITTNFSDYEDLRRVLPKTSAYTAITWTWLPSSTRYRLDPGMTFNPWRGCEKVSPACTNCYAETLSHRNPRVLGEWGARAKRVVTAPNGWEVPLRWNRVADKSGRPMAVFCASLSDFWEDYTGPAANVVTPDGKPYCKSPTANPLDHVRLRVLDMIRRTPHLLWMILTKRPENILPMLRRISAMIPFAENPDRDEFAEWLVSWHEGVCPPQNVWLGVTAETQKYLKERAPVLARVPAVSRFLSVEPMLGPLDLTGMADGIGWVIAGGESGPGWRTVEDEFLRYSDLQSQCQRLGIPFFMKQIAAFRPSDADIPLPLQIRQYPDLNL